MQRRRREPQATVLHRVVLGEWGTFVRRIEAGERSVPRFCMREVEAFLRCGVLGHGFARVFCSACGQSDVVAFSCKGRGFCPSCGTRRMVDTAAWLVDRVIPEEAGVRQWVLSLPFRVRLLCAYDPKVCAAVRRILVRAVSGYYERAARKNGKPRPRTGSVAFEQRFDSGLRLNVHHHVLWLDGVYAWEPGGSVEWCPHEIVRDADVVTLVKRIRDRVVRCLRKTGKWPDEAGGGEAEIDRGAEEQLLLELGSAAVQGRAASGECDVRVGRGTRNEPFVKGPLCAEIDGFSLHAGVRVPAGERGRLERLCRYACRPAIAESRLALLPDGRVAYSLKKQWKDGSRAVVLAPQVLLERLVALVPRPRKHLVTYHGVLAPASGLRSRIVPRVVEDEVLAGEGERGCRHRERAAVEASGAGGASGSQADEATHRVLRRRVVPHAPGRRRRGGVRRRYSWSQLLQRVYEIDVLVCPCGGRRRLLAAVHDPAAIRRVLGALGLSSDVPELTPARGPPMAELWGG